MPDIAAICVGMDTYIARWTKGALLTYNVDRGSFPSEEQYSTTLNAFNIAAGIYNSFNLGVTLQYMDSKASVFALVYTKNCPQTKTFLESAFFPDARPEERVLNIYAKAYYLPNEALLPIFLHALGHIYGLRHEFAFKKEKKCASKLFGKHNHDSIMNYHDDWTLAGMTLQDVSELQNFYALAVEEYQGMPLLDFSP
jgi:hypothetical protein